MSGPLEGIAVIELSGLGPGPFAAMMLADAGAEVIRVERADRVPPGGGAPNPQSGHDPLGRGRRCVGVDLRQAAGVEVVLRLVERADALIEPFRPGVAERLGVGPGACHDRNPRLVYGRMTGWGQEGPWSDHVGHDVNYLSVTGALAAIGPAGGPPVPPLNLVGDMGGGGLLLAYGILAALLETRRSGKGQVVDAAMVDGVALQMGSILGLRTMGLWDDERGTNFLDGGAPFYATYRCADGEWVAVGAIEAPFHAALVEGLGFEPSTVADQHDRTQWPATKARFAERFASRPREEWLEVFAGTDACVTPVLGILESLTHDHHRSRGTFTEVAGEPQPAPAPRWSRTPGAVGRPAAGAGEHTDQVLAEQGFTSAELADLRASGAIA